MRRDIQVVVTVLQIDEENDPEFIGLLGASTALLISDIPWNGPVAGVRVAQWADGVKINPDSSYVVANPPIFDAFVSGSKDRINMIELGGLDAQEKDVVASFKTAQQTINQLIDFQEKIQKEIGKEKTVVMLAEPDPELMAAVETFISDKLEGAVYHPSKMEQQSEIGKLKTALNFHIKEIFEDQGKKVNWKAVDFLF